MRFDNSFEGFLALVALFENFGQRKIIDEYAHPVCHAEGYFQICLASRDVALDVFSELVCQFTLHILRLHRWLNTHGFFLHLAEVFYAGFYQGCFK